MVYRDHETETYNSDLRKRRRPSLTDNKHTRIPLKCVHGTDIKRTKYRLCVHSPFIDPLSDVSLPLYTENISKSKCLTVLMYGLDVCPSNSADRHSLQFSVNKIIYNFFGDMDHVACS